MKSNKQKLLAVLFCLFSMPALFSQSYDLVKDIKPGSASSLSWADPYQVPQLLGKLQNKLLLQVEGSNSISNALWVSDGTEAGTIELTPNNTSWNYLFVEEAGLVFFSIEESDDETGVYQYDGNTLTKLATVGEYYPYDMTYVDGQLYFVVSVGSFDDCLMTPSADVDNPTCIMELENPWAGGLGDLDGQLIGIGLESFASPYLFRSDGTAANSEFFFDLTAQSNSNWNPAWIEGDGQLFFFYQTGGASVHMGLFVTDGTETGTEQIAELWNTGVYPRTPNDKKFYEGNLIFGARNNDSGLGRELYISDGTSSGTSLLKDINPNGDSDPAYFVEYNDLVYFVAVGANDEKQLWQTDGTTNGTIQSFPTMFSATGSYSGDFLTIYDGMLAFIGQSGAEGREVWLSDGTEAGTIAITDGNTGGSSSNFTPRELIAANNNLFFTNYESSTGRELYAYNNGQPDASLSSATSNVDCNDNQTGSNTNDDVITFDLETTATGLGNTFNLSVNMGTITPNTGTHNQTGSYSLQSGSAGSGNVTVTVTDASDPSWASTIVITDPGACSESVSVYDLNSNGQYLVTNPNPFQDQVVFETKELDVTGTYILEIYGSTGQLLKTIDIKANDQLQVDFSDLNSAMLFYQLVDTATKEPMQTGKLIAL